MATNEVYGAHANLNVACTDPATPASGDPVLFGQIPGVALTDEDADGNTVIADAGVFELSVKGIDNAGNAAITAGDKVYYDTATTPKLSADDTGTVFFGYALEDVGSGATATIKVKVGY
jgi:predicted RecA/RadA family phage recombinase